MENYNSLVDRRAKHEPLAYIRGRSEFYGRQFKVSSDTLQPRPETETMIDIFLENFASFESKPASWRTSREIDIIDVGTGSGAILITAALELAKNPPKNRDIKFFGSEISQAALHIARQNAQDLGLDIDFKLGNLLDPFLSKLETRDSKLVVLANLPYVPDSHTINQAAMHEPKVAIFGGPDGLDLYRAMFDQLKRAASHESRAANIVFTESLPPQHRELSKIADKAGFKQIQEEDFIQVFERKS